MHYLKKKLKNTSYSLIYSFYFLQIEILQISFYLNLSMLGHIFG